MLLNDIMITAWMQKQLHILKCKEGNDWLLLSQFVGNQRSSDSWETEGRGHQGKEKHRWRDRYMYLLSNCQIIWKCVVNH